MKKRLLAILCAICLVGTAVGSLSHAEAENTTRKERVFTLSDMVVNGTNQAYEPGTLTGGAVCYIHKEAFGSLQNTVFEGMFTFSSCEGTYGNYLYIGQNWGGIRFATEGENLLFQSMNDELTDIVSSEPIEAEDVGYSLTGREIKLRVGFTFADVQNTTADITVKVQIDDNYSSSFELPDKTMSTMNTVVMMYSYSAPDGSVVCPLEHRAVDTKMPQNMPQISPADFGVADGIYEYTDSNEDGYADTLATGQLQWKKEIPSDYSTVVGKIFSTDIRFMDYGGQIRIGGTEKSENLAWSGLVLIGTSDGLCIMETESNMTIGEHYFNHQAAGLTSLGETFNLKLSFEVADDDGDGKKDDVKLGVWFNNRLYEDTYLYLDGYADYLGDYMLLYCPDNPGSMELSSPYLTPYILEDFGIRKETIDKTYTSTISMNISASSISGRVSLTDDAWIGLYGKEEYSVEGVRLYLENEQLYVKVLTVEDEVESVLLEKSLCEMTEGELFQFSITEEVADYDGNGWKDDVRISFWINEKQYKNQYFYLMDFASHLGGNLTIHPGSGTVFVDDSVNVELYSYASTYKELTFSDFGVSNDTYEIGYCRSDYHVSSVDDLDGVAFTGDIQFGNGDYRDCVRIGGRENGWVGFGIFYANGEIWFWDHIVSETGLVSVTPKQLGVDPLKESVRVRVTFDYDKNGSDVYVTFSINGIQYYGATITGIQSKLGTYMLLQTVNTPMTVYETEIIEADTNHQSVFHEYGYLVEGQGILTVNDKAVSNGTVINAPGDYTIRCEGNSSSVKRVSIYQSGDAHPDGTLDILDLVAVKKRMVGKPLSTKSGEEGADSNRDGIVNQTDYQELCQHLVGKDVMTASTDTWVSFQEGVMPIGGYFGPYRQTAEATTYHGEKYYDYVTDEIYQLIKESGINLIVKSENDYLAAGDKKEILDSLALAEKYNIDVLVSNSHISGEENAEQLAEYLNELTKYKSFKGISIVDEPFTTGYGSSYYQQGIRPLESYATKSTMLNAYQNVLGYINLCPMGPNMVTEGDMVEVYGQYVEDYITTCNPKVLSWDYYPFGGTSYYTKGDRTGYFKNLSIMREKSLKYNIPFWSFVQAGYNWNDSGADRGTWNTQDNTPTKGELTWNVNTALAYGAKGLQYFSLIQPYWFAYGGTDGAIDNFNRNGLIGADGTTTTKWYGYAKEVNQWVATVDEVLMNATTEKVLAVGDEAKQDTGITESSYGELIKITARNGVIVGVFNYQGRTAYYVVNYDTGSWFNQSVTLEFSDEINGFSIQIQGYEKQQQTGNTCTFSLEAGNGALIIVD